ncbi:hypothetical protein LCGC14_1895650, partial [marine sediment metagenome]
MGAKTRILIVDDDLKFRKSLTDTLGAKGYAPIATATGRAALDIVEEEMAVVALIDLKLEDMSGIELMKELKECSPGTECIMITGYASKGSAIEAVNLGAYGYMRKPYDMEQLLVTIRRATEKREAAETLKKSEQRYRALFEDNPIETIVVDKDACITMYNKAKRLSGDRLPQIGDVMYKDYAASHLIDMHQELMECIKLTKSKDFSDQNYKGRFLDIRMFPFEEGAIITSIDQTEKKNLETKLRRTQKMESLGLMAGGIAHDLNNILSGIVSYPDLLLMDLPENSTIRKPIEAIKKSGME